MNSFKNLERECLLISRRFFNRRVVPKLKQLLCLVLVVVMLSSTTISAPRVVAAALTFNYERPASWLPTRSLQLFFDQLSLLDFRFLTSSNSNANVATTSAAALLPTFPFVDSPTNLIVTATSNTEVRMSWTAPSGSVAHYSIERSTSQAGLFSTIGTTTNVSYNDSTVVSDNAYLYRVRAVASGGALSLPSNMALGTAFSFEFSQLQDQLIRAQHVYDIRSAVNAVRAAANLPSGAWERTPLDDLEVQANDVQEIRNQLDQALGILSITWPAYVDPTLASGANGTLIKAIHFEQLQTRSTRGSSSSSGPIDSDLSTARVDPLNETGGGGENPLSRNFNWSFPLVSLPGRAGLDLGLSLSYNSLVWTRSGSYVSFNDDAGFPAPGFRLGFPIIQSPYYNQQLGAMPSYLSCLTALGPNCGRLLRICISPRIPLTSCSIATR